MDLAQLRSALANHFAQDGLIEAAETPAGLDIGFQKGAEIWGLALCPDREGGTAYLGAFEAAMQKVVDARRSGPEPMRLGLGLAFESTAGGQSPSYRRALKKYSNSIVFEDLGLHLLLITSTQAVDVLAPEEVNPFLRDLDRWIKRRSGSAS
jgi:hypothetical protein